MKSSTFSLKDQDGIDVFTYRWEPDGEEPKAVIQIAHGLAEHAGRYVGFAERLTREGYACYANDLRGHGKTSCADVPQGTLGPGGWDSVVRDMKQLTGRIEADHPGLPIFLVGHSWGAYLGQDYAQLHGSGLRGLVQSGSVGSQPFVVRRFGAILARREVRKLGADTPSRLAYNLSFRAYNKSFLPSATDSDFDWLSRDPEVVRKYVADPCCGFMMASGTALEMVLGMKRIWKPENEKKIPSGLPMLFLSGTKDATSAFLRELEPLIERYRSYGFSDVTARFYEGARHEVFNETNREEVFSDLLAWLEARL